MYSNIHYITEKTQNEMTSLCLEQLLTNKKSCSLVIINDTIKLSALPILTDVGKQALEENKNLIVVLTETSPSFWKQQFHTDKVKDMFIIDAFSNPRGWDDSVTEKDSNVLQVNDINNMEELILKPIMKKVMNTAANCTILMDSITPLALISQRRTYQLLKALESLTTDSIRLMVGYHSDIKLTSSTGLNMQDSLKRLASVIIDLEAIKEKTHFETQAALTGFIPQDTFSYLTITSNSIVKGGIANIEWRKKSGKVTYESNGFIFNHQTKRLEVIPKSVIDNEKSITEEELTSATESMQIDPTANLSFNLSLTEEQRKAKENLVLPYLKAQQLEVSIDEEKKTGLIYYDPDAADDFDDEDPDDDLDI
ncbi:unnamed protein product [Mucor hiemalis]